MYTSQLMEAPHGFQFGDEPVDTYPGILPTQIAPQGYRSNQEYYYNHNNLGMPVNQNTFGRESIDFSIGTNYQQSNTDLFLEPRANVNHNQYNNDSNFLNSQVNYDMYDSRMPLHMPIVSNMSEYPKDSHQIQNNPIPTHHQNHYQTLQINTSCQEHLTHLNNYLDDRINDLKAKIEQHQRELAELDKLSNNPHQLKQLTQSGQIDKTQVGKVHTQIVIDAEQSVTENSIKVNSISRKFLGFERREQSDPYNELRIQKLARERARANVKQEHLQPVHQEKNSCVHHQAENQKLSQPQHANEAVQKMKLSQEISQNQHEKKQEVKVKHQLQLKTENPQLLAHSSKTANDDPFGVSFLQKHLKKDSEFLNYLNYKPPQQPFLNNPRNLQTRMSIVHPSISHQQLQQFNQDNHRRNHHHHHNYNIFGGSEQSYRHNKTLDLRTKDSRSNCSSKKRNKYKMLNSKIKYHAVQVALEKGAKKSAEQFQVPLKSLKRWIKVGWERKKGGGRKTKDPEMEKRLYQWYVEMKDQSNPVTAKMIKDMAIKLSSCGDFIASKGWLDKFKIRYRLEISKEAVNLNGQVIDIQGMRDGNSHNSLQLSNLDSQIHID